MAAPQTTSQSAAGDGPQRRRGNGVRLSSRTAGDGATGNVSIHDTLGNHHSVPIALLATEVCATAMGSNGALADWINVPHDRPGRWLAGTALPSSTSARHVIDLAHVIQRARQVWGSDTILHSWLLSPEPSLDDASPLEVVHRGDVGNVLIAIDAHLAASYP